MSLRAEIIRFGLRHIAKPGTKGRPDVALVRRRMELVKCIIPAPPRGTRAARLAVDGIPAVEVTRPQSRDDHHVLYLHGGAYICGSPSHYRDFIWRIADATGTRVLCIAYRLAPEHPFPAAVEDAANAYRWLLAQGADPRRIAVMGDSAGGGLTFGMLLKLRDEQAPLPAAAVALSPWTDLALTGDSLTRNAESDPMLSPDHAKVLTDLYLAGADPRHPYASPIYGDLRGLPPALIHVGSDEILRDDAERLAERLRAAGTVAELEVWPRMPHVWHLFARVLPEAKRAIERIGAFVRRHLQDA